MQIDLISLVTFS